MKSIQLVASIVLGWIVLTVSPAWAHEVTAKSTQPVKMTDAQSIEHAMKALFEKPEAPLVVAPVTVEGDYAVAGWIQHGRGGRALLKKESGKWSIQVCGGDGLKQASALTMTGMDRALADKLARKVAAAEKNLSADQLKKFAMFEGVMRVDGSAHAPHAPHAPHADGAGQHAQPGKH
jgi:hypothetical protein